MDSILQCISAPIDYVGKPGHGSQVHLRRFNLVVKTLTRHVKKDENDAMYSAYSVSVAAIVAPYGEIEDAYFQERDYPIETTSDYRAHSWAIRTSTHNGNATLKYCERSTVRSSGFGATSTGFLHFRMYRKCGHRR